MVPDVSPVYKKVPQVSYVCKKVLFVNFSVKYAYFVAPKPQVSFCCIGGTSPNPKVISFELVLTTIHPTAAHHRSSSYPLTQSDRKPTPPHISTIRTT